MLSFKRLHKWLLSCVLVVTITAASNVYTYQPNTPSFAIELVVNQPKDETATYYVSINNYELTRESDICFKQLLTAENSLVLNKITTQNNEHYNCFCNHQLYYSKLLSLQSCIDLVI